MGRGLFLPAGTPAPPQHRQAVRGGASLRPTGQDPFSGARRTEDASLNPRLKQRLTPAPTGHRGPDEAASWQHAQTP